MDIYNDTGEEVDFKVSGTIIDPDGSVLADDREHIISGDCWCQPQSVDPNDEEAWARITNPDEGFIDGGHE